jgi:periplasmic protein TonB
VRRGSYVLLFSLSLLLSITFSPSCTRQAARDFGKADTDTIAIDTAPVQIYKAPVVFPLEAEIKGITGTVWVKCLIDSAGAVADVVIEKDSGEHVGFEEAAIDAARQNKWEPATYNGKPIAAWVTYKIQFKLREPSSLNKRIFP